MKHRLTKSIVSLVTIICATAAIAEDTPKSALDLGLAAFEESNWDEAKNYLRQAIDHDPENFDANDKFVKVYYRTAGESVDPTLEGKEFSKAQRAALMAERKRLIALYEEWAANDLDNAAYQAMLGDLYSNLDWDKAKHHYLESIELDPMLSAPYGSLANLEDVQGNLEGQVAYLKKAAEVDPDNPDTLFFYTMKIDEAHGFAAYTRAVMSLVKRFPEHDRGAQALFWLAEETKDPQEKIRLFQDVLERYSYEDFRWAAEAMTALFHEYVKVDGHKALEIAEKMVRAADEDNGQLSTAGRWIKNRDYQASIIDAERLIADSEFKAAIELLNSLKTPRGTSDDPYNLAKAAALAGSDSTSAAYDFLTSVSAAKPTDAINSALASYAAELSVSAEQFNADIAAKIEMIAESLEDYSFERIDNDDMVSLSDYKGKVVLINFWYPFCGPCRGENPKIQKILEKYQGRGFEVLALNVHPDEEQFVMSYLTGMDFDFVPLRSSVEFAEEEFRARGYPTNILVDTQGRQIARLPSIHGDYVRTLELQIEALLSEG